MSIAIRGGVMMHMLGDDRCDAHVRVEQRRHSSSSIERTSSEVTTVPTLTRGNTVLRSMEVESSEDHRFGEFELEIPAAFAVFTQEKVDAHGGNSSRYQEISIIRRSIAAALDLLCFDQERIVGVGGHPVTPAGCIHFLQYPHGLGSDR